MRNNIHITVWILIGFLVLMTPSSGLSLEKQKRKSAASKHVLVYKPPLRGAPIGRVGGGTRGVDTGMPFLAALVPEHIGLTLQEQPSLYWYLSESTSNFVEFTLIDDQSIQPLLEIRMDPPVEAGVHSIKLADHNIQLSKEKHYRWFVALVLDSNHRSKDVIAGGIIELIETPEKLKSKIDRAQKVDVPYIYAEAGIWYDAMSSISDLINADPNDSDLRSKRISLIKQVGLIQIEDK